MTAIPSYFEKFLREVRPTDSQKSDYITGHSTLRKRLNEYQNFDGLLVSDFIQGSYRRATAVRPGSGQRADVDVVVVTRLNREDYPDPDDAMDIFDPFLELHYAGKYERQGRSFGIELSYVDLDLVITSAPSEVDENILTSAAVKSAVSLEEAPDWMLKTAWVPPQERQGAYDFAMKAAREEPEWKTEPLWIPNRDVGDWDDTHPLEQIKWTAGKNARCNNHYVNVAKAIKWWKRLQDDLPKHPKGYPLEHTIGYCCPDGIESVAEGVTLTFERMVSEFAPDVSSNTVPVLVDHGVNQNVLARLTPEDFGAFYERVTEAAVLSREALDADTTAESATTWRQLLGSKFPPPPDGGEGKDDPKGPFVPSSSKSASGDYKPRRWGALA